jgi:Raf kinase inhibitor-like YbhB/YbcL family protein
VKINLGTLAVSSTAFEHGGRLPDDQSSNGAGVSPQLSWSGVPDGTTSFAVIVHDPDAPLVRGFTHWVVYGIPADVHELPEGGGDEYTQGVHGMGAPGWAPAAPPPGHGDHFYYFNVYAIGGDVELKPGLTADEVLDQIDEHIIAQARLVGTYSNE